MRIVPTGIDITAYNPGSGAGMIAVVSVLNEDKHAKIDTSAISLAENDPLLNLPSSP